MKQLIEEGNLEEVAKMLTKISECNLQSVNWLQSITYDLHTLYETLRNDIKENANIWTYSYFCERLAYHYYNLSIKYYDLVFKEKINVNKNIIKWLNKCKDHLREIPKHNLTEDAKVLHESAESLLEAINAMYKRSKILVLDDCATTLQLKQQIQLLTIINTLEESLTLCEYKTVWKTANQYQCLSESYRLAGHESLSVKYRQLQEDHILKTIFNDEPDSIDSKTMIISIIKNEVTKYKMDLNDVKSIIEKRYPLVSNNSIDQLFIEQKYVLYCVRNWLDEVRNYLEKLNEMKNSEALQSIFFSLETINNLNDIPYPMNRDDYYKLLVKHVDIIADDTVSLLMIEFKKECTKIILSYCASMKYELEFIDAFLNFIHSFKNYQLPIINQLNLKDYYDDYIHFDELFNNIMALDNKQIQRDNLRDLQQKAEMLRTKTDLFLESKLKTAIREYITPYLQIGEQFTILTENNRHYIEITHSNIVLSEIILDLEDFVVKNNIVEEVRFVGANIMHIDNNLDNKIWHGKNIVVYVKHIKIYDQVVWNLSGKNNDHVYKTPANDATKFGQHGADGLDGMAGESGGNVFIQSESIENAQNFTIISNGGNGSIGQDGGRGGCGRKGLSITKDELKRLHPSIVEKQRKEIACVDNDATISNLNENMSELNYNSTINDSRDEDSVGFYLRFREATKNNGQVITFSYQGVTGLSSFVGNVTSIIPGTSISRMFRRQMLILYKGTTGEAGLPGGVGGVGGEGGYAGEIQIADPGIHVQCRRGKAGDNGKGGLYGEHGKTGWDIGYTDYQFWNDLQFFGQDQRTKLQVKYYKNDNDDQTRIWCGNKKQWGEIVPVDSIENKNKTLNQRNEKRKKQTEINRKASAVKQKSISQQNMEMNYSNSFFNIKDIFETIGERVNRMEQLAESQSLQKEKEEIQINISTKINRHVNYQNKKRIKKSVPHIESNDNKPECLKLSFQKFMSDLTSHPNLLEYWQHGVKQMTLNLDECRKLYPEFLKASEQNPNDWRNVKDLLLKKYRFGVLKGIHEHFKLTMDYEITNTDQLKIPKNDQIRYLKRCESSGQPKNVIMDTIFLHKLGTFNQYFNEADDELTKRKQITKYIQKQMKQTDKIFKLSFMLYILETGKKTNSEEINQIIYNKYENYLNSQKKNLESLMASIKTELSTNKQLFGEWFASINDARKRFDFESKIQSNKQLYDLYKKFNDSLHLQFDIQEIISTYSDITKKYYTYLEERGPFSACYRETVCLIFDVSLALYYEDNDNLYLFDRHNINAQQHLNCIFENEEFRELIIDTNFVKLHFMRNKMNNIYDNVLNSIYHRSNNLDELDKYFNNQLYLENNSNNIMDEELIIEDAEQIESIVALFEDGRDTLKDRLETITCNMTNSATLLKTIADRLSTDTTITYNEMCYIILTIMNCVNNCKQELYIIEWIFSVYTPTQWIDELLLMEFENYFRIPLDRDLKDKWRTFLLNICNKNILILLVKELNAYNQKINVDRLDETLHLLSKTENVINSLRNLQLTEWAYALKEAYWKNKLKTLIEWNSNELLEIASYYLLSIENKTSTILIKLLIELLNKNKLQLTPELLTKNILTHFYNGDWNLNSDVIIILSKYKISDWGKEMKKIQHTDDKIRHITTLVQLIRSDTNNSSAIIDTLSRIENLITSISSKKYTSDIYLVDKPILNYTVEDVRNWVKVFKGSPKNVNNDEIIAIVNQGIYLCRGFYLRDTQKLAIFLLLQNNKSTLEQVSTGEGKSLIVVGTAIVKAITGEYVDVITSSSVLAKRDSESEPPKGSSDIYELFGITVSNNCSENIEDRKKIYSECHVVYGDLSNFQRDYLLDKFYGKNILGNRFNRFQNVIVDEVDSLLLDKGNNMLYLSHDIPDLDKLESLYIFIWQRVNKAVTSLTELGNVFNVNLLKEAVINDLYGMITKNDLKELIIKAPTPSVVNKIWESLINKRILNKQGRILIKQINPENLDQVFTSEYSKYKDDFEFLLNERLHRERAINVPNCLLPFIELHLESWIQNAITALLMQVGNDYVVDVDRTGTSTDINPNIVILDRDTGTDLSNSQWDEALHQFLQLKHGCRLSLQSLKAVFISNVSYFKLYSNLYGLTGTLGTQVERMSLKELYNVDFITIPTAKRKLFTEYQPILCAAKHDWIQKICDKTDEIVNKRARSVLIICETIQDTDLLHKNFKLQKQLNVYCYKRDYEELSISQGNQHLESGQIVIATNLAGRGTDIKLSDQLKNNGGLHVILSYLPNNTRIEQQAFGRAARCGEPGSGQLIISSDGQGYSIVQVINLKKERDIEELQRISEIKKYFTTQISIEEECFEKFKKVYENLSKKLKQSDLKTPEEVHNILMQSCLDKWTFWLDKNTKQMKNTTGGQDKSALDNSLNDFLNELKSLNPDKLKWKTWVNNNSNKAIMLGKYLCKNRPNRFKEGAKEMVNTVSEIFEGDDVFLDYIKVAMELFNQVIANEPHHAEVARYYKAYVHGKKFGEANHSKSNVKMELRKAAEGFEERSRVNSNYAAIINLIAEKSNSCQINTYADQKENICKLYSFFTKSIHDILGQAVYPFTLVDNVYVNDEVAHVLHDVFLTEGLLVQSKVSNKLPSKQLKNICESYGIQFDDLRSFLQNYRGKEIDLNDFRKTIGKHFCLPSRKLFWKELVEQNVFKDEKRFVMIDYQKLKNTNHCVAELINTKVKNNELKTYDLNANSSNSNIIYYNSEMVEECRKKTGFVTYVVNKSDCLKYMTKKMYVRLKTYGVLCTNRKAFIVKEQLENVTFSRYDQVTSDDFLVENITPAKAGMILEALVKNGTLKKSNNVYKINKKNSNSIKLADHEIYENAVDAIIERSFQFRFALDSLASQVHKGQAMISIPLIVNPHNSVMSELISFNIIKPTRVKKNIDVESKVKDIFKRPNTIPVFDYVGRQFEKVFDIEEADLTKTIKRILKNDKLSIDDFISMVAQNLNYLSGSINMLESPDTFFYSIVECIQKGDFSSLQELYAFKLQGLDDLIKFNEKKYTLKMLFYTAAVFAFGLAQIILGAWMEAYSAGLFTHMAGVCVSEGVSDLMYAMSALNSGYFSLKHYANHKITSLLISISSAGLAALISKGIRVSRYGYKLFGNTSKKLMESTGKDLIAQVGKEAVKWEIQKRILTKATEGILFGLASTQIENVCNNYISQICQNVSANICSGFSNIDQKFKNHPISQTTKNLYNCLGRDQAKSIINHYTQKILHSDNNAKEIVSMTAGFMNIVSGGISGGMAKRKMALNNKYTAIFEIIQYFSYVVNKINDALRYLDLVQIMNQFLDDLNTELQTHAKANNINNNNLEVKNKSEFKEFEEELLKMWKEEFSKRSSQILLDTLIRPALDACVRSLYEKTKKYLKDRQKSRMNDTIMKQIKQMRDEHQRNLDNLITAGAPPEEIEYLNKEYYKQLFECCANITDPKLYAKIIANNVPMGVVCVEASVPLLEALLNTKVQIIIEKENSDLQQIFGNEGGETIRFKLEDNHFFIDGDHSTNLGNDCYYEALLKKYPELRNVLSAQEFRQKICEHILTDPSVKNTLSRRWHKHYLMKGGYGGAKRELSSNKVKDVNIRTNRKLTQLETQNQISEALNIALNNLNSELQIIGKDPSIRVQPSDFKITYVDTVLASSGMGSHELKLCPVEMIAEVTIIDPKTKRSVVYKVELNIDNPTESNNGPEGAHIGYSLKGPNAGMVAHVFIDNNPHIPDRARGSTMARNTNNFPIIENLFKVSGETVYRRVTPTRNKQNFLGERFSFTPDNYGGFYHEYDN